MNFSRFNLHSPARAALWQAQQDRVASLLAQIKEEAFDGAASTEVDYVSRFSGLAQPNLALGTTTELAGFIAVCVSPKDPAHLRVLASNGHTAARYDGPPEELPQLLRRGLERWLSQPRYRQHGAPGIAAGEA